MDAATFKRRRHHSAFPLRRAAGTLDFGSCCCLRAIAPRNAAWSLHMSTAEHPDKASPDSAATAQATTPAEPSLEAPLTPKTSSGAGTAPAEPAAVEEASTG